MQSSGFDVAIVGAGIIGLAHALAAVKAGKRVVVIDRDPRANGASIRNFGFITVTGQERGESWSLAMRTRDVWAEVAPEAGIAVEQNGFILTLRHPEAIGVVEAFLKTEMGEGCAWLDAQRLRADHPEIAAHDAIGALVSPHELRVESRTALPRLVAWLKAAHGVTFLTETAVYSAVPPRIETSRGPVEAAAAIVCPGDDFSTLFPDRVAAYRPRRSRLSMLRLAPPGFRLPAPVLSDLTLLRYAGYAALPEAEALRQRLAVEQAVHLAHGVHLIAVQSADGSLVVGDSHHYDDLPPPFAPAEAEDCILDEFQRATGVTPPPVIERWVGTYAVSDGRNFFIDAPADNVRVVIVTSGTGASTGFGIAERTVADLFGHKAGAPA
ncbi:MAG TPA: TIGR03364 family FAD-dependent oxidoreductase [Alphaproteobacteria bacterium]|jgi:FAD dependent oxidoreductase TIGR03364|nr:TIGR03364 family FAD-dependent oxidoreductase [Alphaproteobacteria bacterium]